jgi:hypothetical protein
MTSTIRTSWNAAVAVALAALFAAAALLAGCGSGSSGASGGSAGANGGASSAGVRHGAPVRASSVPPVSDLQLVTGSPTHQITETLVSFYRAAWQDDAARACGLFSPAGAAGFMQASRTAFPGSATAASPCTHDMDLFAAALGDSVQNLQQTQPNVSGDVLNNVGVAGIEVHGRTATAIAPMNVAAIINPKRIDLVRIGEHWRIDASHSLNKSNLLRILKQAQQSGALHSR